MLSTHPLIRKRSFCGWKFARRIIPCQMEPPPTPVLLRSPHIHWAPDTHRSGSGSAQGGPWLPNFHRSTGVRSMSSVLLLLRKRKCGGKFNTPCPGLGPDSAPHTLGQANPTTPFLAAWRERVFHGFYGKTTWAGIKLRHFFRAVYVFTHSQCIVFLIFPLHFVTTIVSLTRMDLIQMWKTT